MPASMVLPMPTSSEISNRTVDWRRAIIRGTNWYARGSTASPARERNGPADARNPIRSAWRSIAAEALSPRSAAVGVGNCAEVTGSRSGNTPAVSSTAPPRGRRIRKSGLLSGSTTHSRSRTRTREPGENVAVVTWLPSRAEHVGVGSDPPGPVLVMADPHDGPAEVFQPGLGFGVALGGVRIGVDGSVEEDRDRAGAGAVEEVRAGRGRFDEFLGTGGQVVVVVAQERQEVSFQLGVTPRGQVIDLFGGGAPVSPAFDSGPGQGQE